VGRREGALRKAGRRQRAQLGFYRFEMYSTPEGSEKIGKYTKK
jgi:hypothetical protein